MVKHLVCADDIEDACHTLTDYILTNPTDDVLDFLTTPVVVFEVLHAAWSVFEVREPLSRCPSCFPAPSAHEHSNSLPTALAWHTAATELTCKVTLLSDEKSTAPW